MKKNGKASETCWTLSIISTFMMEVPGKNSREKLAEGILEQIMARNFPNLMTSKKLNKFQEG